jgi:predicted DNA-binding transcriptional regulator YafY
VEQTVKDQVPWSVLHVLKPRFAQAKAKLEGISTRNNKARWLDKVASIPRNLTLIPPQYSQETLDTVQTALLEERELHIAYKSLQDKTPRPRDVHPRALLQKGPVTYLIANKANDTTPRLYAIHRISEAYRTGRPVGRSPFNLKNYLVEQAHEVGTGEWLDLELWVSVNLAKILKETPLAKGQTLTEVDDGARVQARIKDTLPLRQWIRGHGPAVEVQGPAGLRQTVAADLRTAADRYSKPSRRKPSQAA